MNSQVLKIRIEGPTDRLSELQSLLNQLVKGFQVHLLESSLIEPNSHKPEPVQTNSSSEQSNTPRKEILTRSEAAEYLTLSKHTLYRYTSERKIPFYRVGGRVLMKSEDLDAWMDSRRIDSVFY